MSLPGRLHSLRQPPRRPPIPSAWTSSLSTMDTPNPSRFERAYQNYEYESYRRDALHSRPSRIPRPVRGGSRRRYVSREERREAGDSESAAGRTYRLVPNEPRVLTMRDGSLRVPTPIRPGTEISRTRVPEFQIQSPSPLYTDPHFPDFQAAEYDYTAIPTGGYDYTAIPTTNYTYQAIPTTDPEFFEPKEIPPNPHPPPLNQLSPEDCFWRFCITCRRLIAMEPEHEGSGKRNGCSICDREIDMRFPPAAVEYKGSEGLRLSLENEKRRESLEKEKRTGREKEERAWFRDLRAEWERLDVRDLGAGRREDLMWNEEKVLWSELVNGIRGTRVGDGGEVQRMDLTRRGGDEAGAGEIG